MVLVVVGLLVVMAVAALVTTFVAYPHRGEAIPHAAWLTDVMKNAHDKITR